MKDSICILAIGLLLVGCSGRKGADGGASFGTQNEAAVDSACSDTLSHGAAAVELENDSMPPPPPEDGQHDGPPPKDGDFDGPPPPPDDGHFGGPPPEDGRHGGPPPEDGRHGGPPPHDDGQRDNMRGFDPASEDDMDDNGMSRYMENNDEEGWD